jgi:kinesin family protein 18/19
MPLSETNKNKCPTIISLSWTYNVLFFLLQVIYDLLERSSGHLELREDPDQGITVAGLKRIQV